MRLRWLLLVAVTSLVSGDPDLRQLLHIWRPTPALTWSQVTPECAQAMDDFSLALSQRQQWASSMLDASGEATQYLAGNDFWFGSRPQCEQVNKDYSNLTSMNDFPIAVYRILKLKVNVSEPLVAPQQWDRISWILPRSMWLGICVPGACGDAAQVSALLRQMLDAAQLESNFRDVQLEYVKILPSKFSVWGETPTTLLILLCIIALGLAMVGTAVDLWQTHFSNNKFNGSWCSVILAFSLPKNAHKMFQMTNSSKGSLPALHGIRSLSMVWVITSHFLIFFFFRAENPNFRHIAENNIFYHFVSNGVLAVDSFFFITGVLLSHAFLRNQNVENKTDSFFEASSKFIWITFYRILRLLVPFAFIILITYVTFKQLNADSLFESFNDEVTNCSKTWWRSILFISNLFPISEMCITWGWYLGADTQIYILSTVILLLYVNRYSRLALGIGGVLLMSSWVAAAVTAFNSEYIPDVKQPFVLSDSLYMKPWGHIGPVWVGIVTGWLLNRRIFVAGKLQLALGWLCCTFCMCATLFAAEFSSWFSLVAAATYLALRNTIWGIFLAWILLACTHKRAGWIGSILESPMFIPFGRATFCTYLIHYPMLEWVFMNLEGPLPISRGLGMAASFGFIFTTFGTGAIISLLFESPMIRLLDLLRPSHLSDKKYQSAQVINMQNMNVL